MINVIKRDGKVVDFDLSKISEAMKKAFKAAEKSTTRIYSSFLRFV